MFKKRLPVAIGIFLSLAIFFIIGIKLGIYIKARDCSNNNIVLSGKIDKKHIKSAFKSNMDMDMYLMNKKDLQKDREKAVEKKLAEDKKNNCSNEIKPPDDKDKTPPPPPEKIAYLTFDDGPSGEVTPKILDTLKKYNIKATFFVIGSEVEKNSDLVKRTVAEGHIVGNHTYSHDEKLLYSSPEGFMNDLHKCEDVLKSAIPGYNCKLIRFPYGSKKFASKAIIEAVIKSGYHYVDWNCLSRDAEIPNPTPEILLGELKRSGKNKFKLIVLMHDSVPATAAVLPEAIEYLKAQGYSFRQLE